MKNIENYEEKRNKQVWINLKEGKLNPDGGGTWSELGNNEIYENLRNYANHNIWHINSC